MEQISVNTLQELKDNGYQLSASCNHYRCKHAAWLDLDQLIEKLGPDYVVGGNPDFRKKLICDVCKSRDVQLTLHANTERPRK